MPTSERKHGLSHVLEERFQKKLAQKSALPTTTSEKSASYFLFEERFRGSREDIKQRQLAFLSYFEKCSRVLDIGCGRGEFLEILKDQDIGAIGVDSDPGYGGLLSFPSVSGGTQRMQSPISRHLKIKV